MLAKYYEQTKSVNTLPVRAYYVPFAKGQKRAFRDESKRFQSLNGVWNIKAYDSVLKADKFWETVGENKIDVPSCVQYYGYDYFQYTNIRYPFPYDPPYIPKNNPAYHYSREFTLDNADESCQIVFEGVDSSFYVYVNNEFVGYSCIPHRLSEFDITEFVKEGVNKLDLLVLKWSAGSYLEDQDKWRFTGIFRDVYLLHRPKERIEDYAIITEIEGSNGKVIFENRSAVSIIVEIAGQEKQVGAKQTEQFTIADARLWSAENPYLYDMVLTANQEVIYERIGIRTSKVEDGIYYFNNKPIKFYGVNRHDFHPDKGATVSYEDMKKDILLMKSLHVNALRTSHYPASPLLYELCDEYGLYVMSESDLEAHGCCMTGKKGVDNNKHMGDVVENSFFFDDICQRQICNVELLKNKTCICIWSIGNEAGWGEGMRLAIKEIKKRDSRPVHYEGVAQYYLYDEFKGDYYNNGLDMLSRMYPHVDWMRDVYLKDKNEKRPLVLCEYVQSMGNGPGGMKEYWELMDSNPRFMGGYLWQWMDHGLRHNGSDFRYGGDLGEVMHDGNCCINGIVDADRNVKAGTYQMKKCYQPIYITLENGVLKLFNRNYFEVISGQLEIDGEKVSVAIEPRKSVEIATDKTEFLANFIVDGKVIAYEQFANSVEPLTFEKAKELKIEETDYDVTVKTKNGEIVISKINGEIESVEMNGTKYGSINLNLYRACTDNDKFLRLRWDRWRLHHVRPIVYDSMVSKDSVEFYVKVGYMETIHIVEGKLKYEFTDNGVAITFDYTTNEGDFFLYLGRVGFKMNLDKSYESVKYNGYGPMETYNDLYTYSTLGTYENKVKNELYPYIKPQESGSHYAPRWAEITDGKNVVKIRGMQSFSALPYSIEQLINAKHRDELPKQDATYLSADICMGGMGTGSCGPDALPQYRVPKDGKGTILFEFVKK